MVSTTSTPPALPLPPACTWALTTHLSTSRDLAMLTASSLVSAARPSETEILYSLNNCLA